MNNVLKILAIGCIALMSCNPEPAKPVVNNLYELSIDDINIPLDGIDYTLTDRVLFPEDSTAFYQTNESMVNLTLTKPDSDKGSVSILYQGNEVYTGDGKNITISLSTDEEQAYEIKTKYRKPLKFYVKYLTDNTLTIIPPTPTPTPDPEPTPDPVPPTPNKTDTLNIEFANEPNYELVRIQIDGKDVYMYRIKKNIVPPTPKRLKNLNTIAKNSSNCLGGEVGKGPFTFTITPKTPIELNNIKVIGGNQWEASINISGPNLERNINDERVVANNCEINLQTNNSKLLIGKTYTVSISANAGQGTLVNLVNCKANLKSNKHMTISGGGANFIHTLSYKH